MLNQVIPPSSVQTYLNMIHAKTMTLNSLLDDLIQVSYFTSQTLDYKYYEIDAFNFFKSTIAQMEFQVVQSGRIFYSENHLKANMTVILDASRIEQVILNLVSNSIRHTPHRGKISITCRRVKNSGVITDDLSTAMPEGEIIFTVSDTGQGVHPDDLPHLFERKFRGRNSQGVTTGAGNSGLGLYISLQIIRHHSGKIWVENIEGGGASFSFSIPYYAN